MRGNRFSGFCRRVKTAEAVSSALHLVITPLKSLVSTQVPKTRWRDGSDVVPSDRRGSDSPPPRPRRQSRRNHGHDVRAVAPTQSENRSENDTLPDLCRCQWEKRGVDERFPGINRIQHFQTSYSAGFSFLPAPRGRMPVFQGFARWHGLGSIVNSVSSHENVPTHDAGSVGGAVATGTNRAPAIR